MMGLVVQRILLEDSVERVNLEWMGHLTALTILYICGSDQMQIGQEKDLPSHGMLLNHVKTRLCKKKIKLTTFLKQG